MEIKLHLEQTSMQLLTIIQKTLVPGYFKLIYFFKYSEFAQEYLQKIAKTSAKLISVLFT